MSRRLIFFAPLALLLLFGIVAAWRLSHPTDTTIRSRLEGQPIPAFTLDPALAGRPGLSAADFADGQPKLLNIFGSWCVPCIAEAPVLLELKNRGVRIEGVALRDRPADIAKFLAQNGDPYRAIGNDPDSRLQLLLGSSGVPESFVIDGKGVIRYQHIGPITPQEIADILRELEQAK